MYIDADLINDETAVAEAILAAIADRLSAALGLAPEEAWEPSEGGPETSLAEAVGIVVATAASLVQEDERDDYAGFGELILGLNRTAAQAAEGASRWTFTASGTYVIPDGSELVLDAPDGTPVVYATVGDFEASGTAAVDVPTVAVEPGAIANGLTGAARDWEPLPFVSAVEMTTAPSGGTDEQTKEEYLDDVARRARRMKIVPVVTDDYADTAIDHPSVARAIAVRLLNLTAPTDPPNSPGHVSVFVVDAAGNALSTALKDEVKLLFQAEDRPLAVTAHVGDPTYTNLTITTSVYLDPEADVPATMTAIQAAISEAYSRANYGLDENAAGRWRAPRTTAERTITNYDVAAVIETVDGVDRVSAVTVNGGTSVTLTGWAPLPNLTAPATVTVL